MHPLMIVGVLLVAAALLIVGARLLARRRAARERLLAIDAAAPDDEPIVDDAVRPVLRDWRWIIPATGLALFVVLFAFGTPWPLALGFGAIGAALAAIADDARVNRVESRVDHDLATVIDLMVSGLRGGSSPLDALDLALNESRAPLRGVLEHVSSRLRLGDQPRAVFGQLSRRLPLDSVRLFAFVLNVNWDAGGSLASALASIGARVRDAREVIRRVRTQAAESRFSVVAVLVITYALAGLMYYANPARTSAFFASSFGVWATAAAVVLQGIGLVWMMRLTRVVT